MNPLSSLTGMATSCQRAQPGRRLQSQTEMLARNYKGVGGRVLPIEGQNEQSGWLKGRYVTDEVGGDK